MRLAHVVWSPLQWVGRLSLEAPWVGATSGPRGSGRRTPLRDCRGSTTDAPKIATGGPPDRLRGGDTRDPARGCWARDRRDVEALVAGTRVRRCSPDR